MKEIIDRRKFAKIAALGVAGASIPAWAQKKRDLQIGHTGLTWLPLGGPSPPPGGNPMANPDFVEQAAKEISSLGFRGVEFFGNQIEAMEEHGGVGPLLEKYKLPLISAYCGGNLTDPAQRKATIDQWVRWAKLLKKYEAKVVVIGPNGVKRDTYDFKQNKANIVTTLNEGAKAVADVGLTAVLHQHTGTCVETRDETYAVLDAVDTKYVKFGPDIGQLQKGGSDPVQVVKDYLSIVHHMHLKDYAGGQNFLGYCPLGEGKVNIPGILDMMQGRKTDGRIMVELDSPPPAPMPALETAKIAKRYLQKQGVTFRA